MAAPIPVLRFHSISDARAGDSFAVTRAQFERHVDAIAACGRHCVTMSELAAGLRGLRPLPDLCIAITFDHGYLDTVAALALLRARGLAATLYVNTGAVGRDAAIARGQVCELAGWDGVELGAQTDTHPRLDALRTTVARDEIRRAKHELEQLTGTRANAFAYPNGGFDHRVRGLVIDAGFTSAAAVKNALSHPRDDPFAIARWTVRSTTTAGDVAAVLNGTGAPRARHGQRVRTRAFRVVRRARGSLVRAAA
jgi:peptidoglycan/xylan/chitin deacetylase (PgdA/CDA1 family)